VCSCSPSTDRKLLLLYRHTSVQQWARCQMVCCHQSVHIQHTRSICHPRHFLSTMTSACCSIVATRLDYCNSLFHARCSRIDVLTSSNALKSTSRESLDAVLATEVRIHMCVVPYCKLIAYADRFTDNYQFDVALKTAKTWPCPPVRPWSATVTIKEK